MIELRNVTKSYKTKYGRHYVYRNVCAIFPEGKNIGIIGPNGAGKTTLLRLIGKIDYPDSGEILTNKTISWPVAFSGGFQGSLTGFEIVKFVCMIYGSNGEMPDKIKFVKDFTELGKYFDMPIKTYSAGMKARLAFALSMAFDFDYYLIDEVTAVGDISFRKKCNQILRKKLKKSNVIMTSHDIEKLRKFCHIFVIPYQGDLVVFDKFREAAKFYANISKNSAIPELVSKAR
ncbi:MAG: ABC transporter ATP-binding protein [Thermodesulfovibrionales bacterium]|nr:ABC transporter ATP-binding protein [Thermodesulfovibrionales bacterium]